MDFQVLFGYLNSPQHGSDMISSDQQGPLQPIEFIKVLHLHSVFTKVNAYSSAYESMTSFKMSYTV